MTDLGHVRQGGLERSPLSQSSEDQISTDVRDVVQVPKSDLMARGVAIDLLQMAKRVGPHCEAAKHNDLPGEESFSADSAIIDD